MRAMEVVTYICGAIAAFILIVGFTAANGAPQEASAAALAAALVIIPYCITATMHRRAALKAATPPRAD
jgi:hypothetical protein